MTVLSGDGGLMVIPAQLTLIVKDCSPWHPFLSVARMVKVALPTTVGVPLTVAVVLVALASVSPGFNDPSDTVQVYGPVPPEAVKVLE